MFNQPQDRSMFLNSVSPAEASSQAADAGGPQSQVHAGQSGQTATAERLLLAHNQPAYETVHRLVRELNALIWDRAVELSNAEPSVPIPVASRSKADEHQELVRTLTDRRPDRG